MRPRPLHTQEQAIVHAPFKVFVAIARADE